MNITDKALGVAEDAWYENADLEEALKAAAPLIAAQELFTMQTQAPGLNSAALKWLSRRRAELEGGAR